MSKEGKRVWYSGERREDGFCLVAKHVGDGFGPLYCDPHWAGPLPCPYSWGDASAGSRLLAMALLSDVIGAVGLAHLYADDYVAEHVATWQGDGWATTYLAITAWVIQKCQADLIHLGEVREANPIERPEPERDLGAVRAEQLREGTGNGQ